MKWCARRAYIFDFYGYNVFLPLHVQERYYFLRNVFYDTGGAKKTPGKRT